MRIGRWKRWRCSGRRRRRVGLVSADLREHPVGRFVLPLLERHDRERFEFVAYSDARKSDGMTAALRRACAQWHDVAGVSDVALAERVREDQIDILIDL